MKHVYSKRALSLALVLLLLVGSLPAAFAAGDFDNPFLDVPDDAWFIDDLAYVYSAGMMRGTSETTFSPEKITSRGMIVAILHRLEGEPAPAAPCAFTDVPSGSYYEDAIAWAAENGIVTGYGDGKFGPDDPISRQQMAAFLYRYASMKGYVISATGDLSKFSDSGKISGYAVMPLRWATGHSLINGRNNGTLDPLGYASRSHVAAILHRFCNMVEAQKELTTSFETKRISTSSGTVTANVLTVNTGNPRVEVKACLNSGKLGNAQSFSSICAASGAYAVVTGNFMDFGSGTNFPVGTVMIDGELKYIGNNISAIGIREDGSIVTGRPDIRIFVTGASAQWAAIGLNLPIAQQSESYSLIYTAAFGSSFKVTTGGYAYTVSGGTVRSADRVESGRQLSIPTDGFVYLVCDSFISSFSPKSIGPEVGESVTLKYANSSGSEAFPLEGLQTMFCGGPRLVTNGAIDNYIEPQFDHYKFTDISSSRTAVGVAGDNCLIFVTTGSASMQQMREVMLALGCTFAFNLDGGASTAMYYNGSTVYQAGRNLANTIQIFVD